MIGAVSNSSSTALWLNKHHQHLHTFGRAGATPVALKALVIAVVPAGVRVSVVSIASSTALAEDTKSVSFAP